MNQPVRYISLGTTLRRSSLGVMVRYLLVGFHRTHVAEPRFYYSPTRPSRDRLQRIAQDPRHEHTVHLSARSHSSVIAINQGSPPERCQA